MRRAPADATRKDGGKPSTSATRVKRPGPVTLDRFLEHVPTAFFLTQGAEHLLVSANVAGRRMLAWNGSDAAGQPIRAAIPGSGALTAVLDIAFGTGVAIHDHEVGPIGRDTAGAWCCSVWPQAARGDGPAQLLVELHAMAHPSPAIALQRAVTERLLLAALRERDLAEAADSARDRATFLAAESERLTETLDSAQTERAVARSALPHPGSWCMVDLVEEDGTMHRLAIVHPDRAKQALATELAHGWAPEPGDAFGMPAMLRDARPTVASPDLEELELAPARELRASTTQRILRALGVGTLLTVPLVIRERLAGALTFVSAERHHVFAPEDIELALALAQRNAMALDSARQYAAALALRARAEEESRAKSDFIGTMSHELRTPLTAIAGYVDLIDMGLRGPVTPQQRADLSRIRISQQHLVAVITNVLNLMRVGEGAMEYHIVRVPVAAAIATVVDMLEPLLRQGELVPAIAPVEESAVVLADPERVTQILINLLGNAIKFTAPGGRVGIEVELTSRRVGVHVSDSGIGIPAGDCARIFDPFIQTREGRKARGGGVGLGLAISRALARGMGGDLTVQSEYGVGSRFTLTLPRAE